MTEIEELDARGRELGIVIYSVHQCNAGWGVQWAELQGDDLDWRQRLIVYNYYPNITAMVEAETERLRRLELNGK